MNVRISALVFAGAAGLLAFAWVIDRAPTTAAVPPPVSQASPQASSPPASANPAVALVSCATGAAPTTPAVGDARVRSAAHKGLSYLAEASRAWTTQHRCFGCHVQAVTLEALSAAQHHQYPLGPKDLPEMVRALELGVTAGGRVTGAAFQGAAWARYDRWVDSTHTEDLLRWATELVELQAPSGAVVDDDARRPITGGTMQTTFQAAQAWRQAHARTADERWLRPLRRAEAYLVSTAHAWPDDGRGVDLQDLDFALLGLTASGAPPSDPGSRRLQSMLLARQNQDGGWSLGEEASDAFATGQAVYTLKALGYGDAAPQVRRGLDYLLAHQDSGGSWRTYKSGQGGAEKGETMWAVLGLVTVDVASVSVAGLSDGQHVEGRIALEARATDNVSGGIAQLELRIDDLPVHRVCGDALHYTWDTAALARGPHVVDVVARSRSGEESRHRLEVYAGDVQLSHVAADFDEGRAQTIVTLRHIAAPSARPAFVVMEVWDATEGNDPQPRTLVRREERRAVTGPMSFEWAGTGDDGKARPRGRYFAKVYHREGPDTVRQTETLLFFHDTAAAQREQFAEVEGQLSVDNGKLGAAHTVVELVDAAGKVVQTTRTTEQGNYRFKNVSEGGYRVRTQKSGFAQLEGKVEAKARSKPSSANLAW
jgi:hypothetical protein